MSGVEAGLLISVAIIAGVLGAVVSELQRLRRDLHTRHD